MASGSPALRLDRVRKTFGTHVAVDDLSVTVPPGVIYGFIGPNGAGKTTTLRMIVDIIRPDRGTIEVLGERDPAAIRERIGYLPEERGMYKKMRTLEFIGYIGSLKGMSPAAARERGARLMEEYGLGKWTKANIDNLSKGMSQKLQFISTIVHDPELLILDEPFSGLDPVNIEALKQAVLQSRRAGRTIIFSTHMMEQAERLCDSIFMIHDGHKVLDGPVQEIKSSVARRAVRLRAYGDLDFVKGLPEVERVREYGNDLEIFLRDDASPQKLLREITARTEVSLFDVSEPSLYDIFIEKVAPDRRHTITADGSLVAASESRAAAAGEAAQAPGTTED
ncbi:MAG: ATP-binding cassette domain-containing protein [Candidatus Eisenbacteria bacterium]|nr:ATP-binding cassette domain-containing protein [Candidatus Eisenbacteria bacterium]